MRVAVRAAEVRPDAVHPPRSRAVVHAELALGALNAALDADKAADAVDFKLRADAGSLALVQPLLPKGGAWQAPWEKMSLTLASDGRASSTSPPPRCASTRSWR